MHELERKLKQELKKYDQSGSELSMSDLEVVYKLSSTLKNLYKIDMFEEESEHSERGYSRDGGRWEARGSYDDDRSYDEHGNSYRRRRDSMGRYSRDGGSSERGGESYGEGKEYMVECLEDMMHEAKTAREKDILKRCMNEMKNA